MTNMYCYRNQCAILTKIIPNSEECYRQDGNHSDSFVRYLQPTTKTEVEILDEQLQEAKIAREKKKRPKKEADSSARRETLEQIGLDLGDHTREVLEIIQPPLEWVVNGVHYRQEISDKRVEKDEENRQLYYVVLKKLEDDGSKLNQPLCQIRHDIFQDVFDEIIRQSTCRMPVQGMLLLDCKLEMHKTLDMLSFMALRAAEVSLYKPSWSVDALNIRSAVEKRKFLDDVKKGRLVADKSIVQYLESLVHKSESRRKTFEEEAGAPASIDAVKARRYYTRLLNTISLMSHRGKDSNFGEKVHTWRNLLEEHQTDLKSYLKESIARDRAQVSRLRMESTAQSELDMDIRDIDTMYLSPRSSQAQFERLKDPNPDVGPEDLVAYLKCVGDTACRPETAPISKKKEIDMNLEELRATKAQLERRIQGHFQRFVDVQRECEESQILLDLKWKREETFLELSVYNFAQQMAILMGVLHERDVAEANTELATLRRSSSDFELLLYRKYFGKGEKEEPLKIPGIRISK